ncbi:MAG TPA: DUF4864 domain-containing protein [Burkholderiales bacterium]|jgi:hypothetical protein|nr:DUF4864 domain-containing protein [Burkholderiales bacterium]
MVSLVLCTGVALAFGAGAVGAQDAPVSKGDAGAIEKVIRAQLDAFAADDAAKAFSFAAPGIRQSFGTPDNFMQMVRMGYPVVYRPAAVVFLKPSAVGREVFQPVQMTDHEGQLWIALYNMQRQPGGNWLTGGCRLLRSDGKVTQAAPQLVPI